MKVLTLPLLTSRPFRNHHTMPFSSSRSSKASQRCISHGKLSISADEMGTWKTSPNRSPSPYLLISHHHSLDFILRIFNASLLWKTCAVSTFCSVKGSITISILWAPWSLMTCAHLRLKTEEAVQVHTANRGGGLDAGEELRPHTHTHTHTHTAT